MSKIILTKYKYLIDFLQTIKFKFFNIFVLLPKAKSMANIPIVKKQSPTLLVKNAESELWFAAILVNQKLTSK